MTVTLVSYALTTLAKVKLSLGIDSATTTYDDVLNTLINGVTDFIENYCGSRRFLSTTYTNEIHDSVRGRSQFFTNFPVTTLTTVEYRSGTPSNPTWNTFNADGYLLYGKEGYVKFYATLPEVMQGLRYTYIAGYLIDFAHETDITKHTLPFDLTMVATDLVCKAYNLKQAQGLESMSTEGQTVVFGNLAKKLDDNHELILGNYQTLRLNI